MSKKHILITILVLAVFSLTFLLAYQSMKKNNMLTSPASHDSAKAKSIIEARHYLLDLNVVQKARLRKALSQIDNNLYQNSTGAWDYFVATLNNDAALHIAAQVHVSQDPRRPEDLAKDTSSTAPEKEHIQLIKQCQTCHKNLSRDE